MAMIDDRQACAALETLGAFAEGKLVGAERDQVIAHLAGCEECRRVLAATMQTLEELAAEEDRAAPPLELRRAPQSSWRRRWLGPLVAAAAALALVGSVVVYDASTRDAPPSRDAWLAQMPPARQLLPDIWGGVVLRGTGEEGVLSQQSAELGALLVDVEVALAAGDTERAGEMLRRMATILDQAGFMDEEVAALRATAAADGAHMGALLRAERPRLEERLREGFSTLYLDLGSFAEEARLAAAAGNRDFFAQRRVRRYVAWLLEPHGQDEQPLPPAALEGLAALQRPALSPAQREAAADSVLQAVARW